MSQVTTIDGRVVDSDGEAWRLCCEAVAVLRKPHADREAYFNRVRHHRLDAGLRYLQDEIARVEPAYLLALGSRDVRRAYLAQTEFYEGLTAREHLEQRIVALWEQRKAAPAA